jgi:glutamine amidotransferase-like uncharacterized protein
VIIIFTLAAKKAQMKYKFCLLIGTLVFLLSCTKDSDQNTATSFTELSSSVSRTASGIKVAIYSGTGAESSTILALYRAIASMGDIPLAITKTDILAGRLSKAQFKVLVIPPGEEGKKCCSGKYSDIDALDQVATKDSIKAFVKNGGGLVAEEAGAFFAAQNGGTLDIYAGDYTNVTNQIGKKTFTITDSIFGNGSQEAWQSYGGGYFPNLPSNVFKVAVNSSNQAVIVKQNYGAGRIILTSFVLELRGDTELDWTIWDNWEMGNTHTNSIGVWNMLGRMIGWANNGDASAPTITTRTNPTGSRVAIIAQHTSDGGAWPGLLPAVGKSIEYTGHIPLAIRYTDIKNAKLTLNNFKVVVFPGGYAYGYKTGLAGYEASIRNFISSGGSYYGICAGSFYTPSTIVWDKRSYTYPLSLFAGTDVGPINDIVAWPGYKSSTINYSGDTLLGNFGLIPVMYYGGGFHTIPTDAQQGSHVYTCGTFATSSAIGKANLIRYKYGNGRVALSTSHLEALMGSNDDWMFWDNFDYSTGSSLNYFGTDPWNVMNAIFDKWLTLP